MNDQDDQKNVLSYLTSRGFSDGDAVKIVIQTLIRFGTAPVSCIHDAAADLGFEVPNIVLQSAQHSYQDRN